MFLLKNKAAKKSKNKKNTRNLLWEEEIAYSSTP